LRPRRAHREDGGCRDGRDRGRSPRPVARAASALRPAGEAPRSRRHRLHGLPRRADARRAAGRRTDRAGAIRGAEGTALTGHLEVVFLDIGGVLYEDRWYFTAIREALRDLGAQFTDEEYAAEYDRCRNAQSGSFRARLARRFLPSADPSEVTLQAAKRWHY